jgi:hypothetical protein
MRGCAKKIRLNNIDEVRLCIDSNQISCPFAYNRARFFYHFKLSTAFHATMRYTLSIGSNSDIKFSFELTLILKNKNALALISCRDKKCRIAKAVSIHFMRWIFLYFAKLTQKLTLRVRKLTANCEKLTLKLLLLYDLFKIRNNK